MKLIVDEIGEYPGHAMSRDDIRLILASVPPSWSEKVKVVRVCSSYGENPTVIASLHPSDGSLVIKSRGYSQEGALRALLTELAGHALGVNFLAYRRLPKRDASRVNRVVAPLVAAILPQLARKWVRLI